jgi:hypothetical protein
MGLYPTSVQQRVTNEDSIQHVMMLTCELYWQIPSKGLQAEAGLALCNSDLKSARSIVTRTIPTCQSSCIKLLSLSDD